MRSESYGSQPLQDLDVLIPDDPLDDRAPLFVFVHGGAWFVARARCALGLRL
jgi:acetyl esterase/lipase